MRTRARKFRDSSRSCPVCSGFHTAISAQHNLARCFDCQRGFNPIDLVVVERGASFLEAVDFLEDLA